MNLIIRASELGKILTNPRSGSKLELGQTAKSAIIEMYINNKYGFSSGLWTDPVIKGLLLEAEAIDLLSLARVKYYKKNTEWFTNDYVSGTPDIVSESIIDIKIPDNYMNFFTAEVSDLYYAQGQAYMWLTGIHHFELIYVLMPEPAENIDRRLSYLATKLDEDLYYRAAKEMRGNAEIITQMNPEERIRVFSFEYDPEFIEACKGKIEKAREFYNNLNI